MALPIPGSFNYPTPADIRDAILRTIKLAFGRRGIAANVLPDSDHYVTADALAKRLGLIVANNMLASGEMSPLTATGDRLTLQVGQYGVSRREATGARGWVVCSITGTVVIPKGHRCTAPNGCKYETPSVFTVTGPTAPVEVVAVSTGAATEQTAGTQVTWDSASVGGLHRVATVDTGGLTGGADADDDETLRQRFTEHMTYPGVGGNNADVHEWCHESSTAVDDAFVYAAIRGPGSYDVAVARQEGDRTLAAILPDVAAVVAGAMPGFAKLNVTTVAPQELDIVLGATLPLPTHAGGAGGGWYDSSPWPQGVGRILTVTPAFTVSCVAVPVVGDHMAIWNPDNETMWHTIIMTVTGSSPTWTLTVSPTLPSWVAAGMFISADAEHLDDYATTFATILRHLGAGEKTANIDLLPRSLRHPAPDVSAPYSLTYKQLADIMIAHAELLDLIYLVRMATGTYPAGPTKTAPSLPTLVADPPGILLLKHFAIVRT